jgi:hypothetical protein
MKFNKINIVVVAVLAFVTLGLGACKDKTTTGTTGTFYFHIHANVDTAEIADSATYYRDSAGRFVRVATGSFYISNIVLKNANGTSYPVSGKVVLEKMGTEEYLIGTAPVGTYTGVSFSVGLDPVSNAPISGEYAAGNPLGDSTMWFIPISNGHYFVRLTGSAATSSMGAGALTFDYKVGANGRSRPVTMPTRTATEAYILTAGNNAYIHMVCDFGKLLKGVDLTSQLATDSYTLRPGLADTLADNVVNMFRYEE